MRVRIKLDAVVDFHQLEALPLLNANDFVEYGIKRLLADRDSCFIEPNAKIEMTRLGASGSRMATKKDFAPKKRRRA